MGFLDGVVELATVQLGLKFLVPAFIILALSYHYTGGKTYISLAFSALGGLIFWSIFTALGL